MNAPPVSLIYTRACADAESGTALVIVFDGGGHHVLPMPRAQAFNLLRDLADGLARSQNLPAG